MAAVVVATAVPLCLLRVRYALPSSEGPGSAGPAAVLRAVSLALPFAVAVVPLAALAVRRLCGWPVLLAGLIVIVAGDGLATVDAKSAAASGALAATVGALHGVGAGLAIPATVALVTEHSGSLRRLLSAWWAAVTVAAFAVLPGLGSIQADQPDQPAEGGWLAVLGPVPWLTVAALAATLLYPLLSSGLSPSVRRAARAADRVPARAAARAVDRSSPAGTSRADRPAAEYVWLTLLAPAAAALGVIAVAATYRPADTIVAAAVCGMAGLLVMAAFAFCATAGDGFAVVCAVAGLALAPASAALATASATASASASAGAPSGAPLAVAAVAGAIAGAAMAIAGLVRRGEARASRDRPIAGLLLAAVALAAACLAGPFAATAVSAAGVALVACGLTMALARPASQVTTAGAMVGIVVLVGGALAGYLAAGAVRIQLAGTALAAGGASAGPAGHLNRAGPAAVPHSLVTALGWWEIVCAVIAVTVVIVRCARRATATSVRIHATAIRRQRRQHRQRRTRQQPKHHRRQPKHHRRDTRARGIPFLASKACEKTPGNGERGGRGRGRVRPADG